MEAVTVSREELLALGREAEREIERRERLQQCREDPAAFIEYVFEKHLAEIGAPRLAKHHREWLDDLQAASRGELGTLRILLVAPRESWKSTIVTVGFTAWYIGNHPEETNMIASVSDTQSTRFAGLVGQCIQYNPRWAEVFPEIVPDENKGWSPSLGNLFVKRKDMDYSAWAERVGLRKDPTLFTAGLKGRGSTGARVSGLAVLDDPHDAENSYTDYARERVKRWCKSTLLNLVTERALVVVILTRWHYDDLASELMEQRNSDGSPIWHIINLKALQDDGTSYWPEMWSLERLDAKQAEVGSLIFSCQYQNDPSGLRGRILKDDWLISYPHKDIDETWPCYYGIDFAVTEEEIGLSKSGARDPDYTSITRIRRSPKDGLILDAIYRVRQEFAQALRWVERHQQRDRPVRTKGDVRNVGKGYISMLQAHGLKIQPHISNKRQEVRFQLMSAHFETGTVKVSDEVTPGLLAFRQEWVGFPSATHDDTLASTDACLVAAGLQAIQGGYTSEYAPMVPVDTREVAIYA